MRHLEDEGHKVTKAGAHKFWKCFEEIETIQRKPGKAKFCLKAEEMAADDETTGEELKRVLQKSGIHVCARTAMEWRKKLFLTPVILTKYRSKSKNGSVVRTVLGPYLEKRYGRKTSTFLLFVPYAS